MKSFLPPTFARTIAWTIVTVCFFIGPKSDYLLLAIAYGVIDIATILREQKKS